MHTDEQLPTEESKEKGYEVSDVNPSFMGAGIVVLISLMLLGFAGGAVFYGIFEATEVKSRPEASPLVQRETVEGPLVQAHPEADLKAYLGEQMAKLHEPAWVDRDLKKVRLPIEEAMKAVVTKGFPNWQPQNAKVEEAPAAATE